MKHAAIIIGRNATLKNYDLSDTYNVAVERGCLKAIRQKIHLDLAVGDFDSVSKRELNYIYKNINSVIKLNPVKDDTDAYHAYSLVKECEKITIIGGIQGLRIEHFLALLNIVKADKKVELIDDNSRIFCLDHTDNKYLISENSEYKYISIFAVEDSVVTLSNFKYPLDKYALNTLNSLGISNEVAEGKTGEITVDSGKIIVVETRKDS